MRRLVQSQPGKPEIHWETTAIPSAGPGRTLVRVEAIALNRADVLYMRMAGQRWRLGIDCVGTVVSADAEGPEVGCRVVAHLPEGGAAAELIAVDTHRLVPLPDTVSPAAGAALPLAGLVALRLVRTAGPLHDRRVLITGASGGVGTPLVQLARAHGAHVSAAVRDGEPREHLAAAGARIIRADKDFGDRFDIVFESVGGSIGTRAVAAVAPHGQVVWFGQAGGQPLELDFFSSLEGGQGFSLTHFVYSDHEPDTTSDLGRLVELAAQGLVIPHIGTIEDWTAADAALERIRQGRQPGKAVLTLGTPS